MESNSTILKILEANAEVMGEKIDSRERKIYDKENNKIVRTKESRTVQASASRNTEEIEIPREDPLPQEEAEAANLDLELDGGVFDGMAEQMQQEATPLEKKGKGKKGKNKSQKPPGEKKENSSLKIPSDGLGEEITKEHAENIMSSGKIGGHRATIIVREKIVREAPEAPALTSGEENLVDSSEKKAVPLLSLVREDTGEVFDVDRDLTVGRDDDNDISIPNPEGHYVSSHHARIEVQGKDIYVKDLGSTNGTYINDRKIGSKRIRAGDKVEFGDIVFKAISEA